MLNLIYEQKDIDKIYLYAKDLSEPRYEYLIKNRENAGIKHVNGNAFIDILIRWMLFTRILMIIIQTEEKKY